MSQSPHGFQPSRQSANHVARALPIPIERLDNAQIFQSIADLTKRSPPGSSSSSATSSSSSSSPSHTCGPNDNAGVCQKPTQTATLPIVLGVVIPITVALVVFALLHRRHVKKLRREDADDKHKSLDFGMDMAEGPTNVTRNKGMRGRPVMTVSGLNQEKGQRRGRGLSMDMGSPYLLPPDLQSSRESVHSLSRSVNGGDDRYRPATTFIPNDGSSIKSYGDSTRKGGDNSSTYTASSGPGYGHENQDLLRNAQRMSRSVPTVQRNSKISGYKAPQINAPDGSYGGVLRKVSPPGLASGGLVPSSAGAADNSRDSYMSNDADMRRSHNYLGAFIHSREPSAELLTKTLAPVVPQELPSTNPARLSPAAAVAHELSTEATQKTAADTLPPRMQSIAAPTAAPTAAPVATPAFEEGNRHFYDNESNYGDEFEDPPPSIPPINVGRHSLEVPMTVPEEFNTGGLEAPELGFDPHRLSMGFRPLPPEDPTDNPEQRANRIRSFYKEYFDDSKPDPMPQATYQEDYGQEYLADANGFDPMTAQFAAAQAPYAQPMARRAMTPPPRAPPRFQPPPRHQSTMSGGHFTGPGPRAFSSQSGQVGPANRVPPRRPMAPPAPLRILPTPHLLKDDSFALPIDFAPPTSYKDRQAGRPESPLGGTRPYSPMLPAHLPLASSFDDLSTMPSPHALRKSSTFTALDFASVPRFKNADSGSDAGSIRSNRSGMSAAQLHSIRAGAYRVSRIPKEVVGTKTDIVNSLKPTWDLRPQGS